MSGLWRIAAWSVVTSLALAACTSCRKPKDTLKSDLVDAGYQLTAADWFRASANNDVSALKKFVGTGFDIKTLSGAGDTALHAAATAGGKDAADYLMNRGLAVDTRGANGRTPLMVAALADQPIMVRWLVKQGAKPQTEDDDGFSPLMLAVRENKPQVVAELAPMDRERLDSAILLASMEGHARVIDVLANYGASVFARMDDGRTPLMLAAENGKSDAVAMLLDIGAGRHAIDANGKTAAELAAAAGHHEMAARINQNPKSADLALETPDEISRNMDSFVESAMADQPGVDRTTGENTAGPPAASGNNRTPSAGVARPSRPIAGEVLSAPVAAAEPSAQPSPRGSAPVTVAKRFALPPLVMRHYREREMPLKVTTVAGDTATVRVIGPSSREVKVRAGESIPGSSLMVVRVEHRVDRSKLNEGRPTDVSVVEVKDTRSGVSRKWIAGVPSNAHDPVAMVEDAATGKRYTAIPGQRFKSAGGAEFIVSDVRPNQVVIEEVTTGATQTIPLRGPRG